MIDMQQKHFEVIQEYVQLLGVIEEGFEYIEARYKNGEMFAGDRILGDVFLGFTQIEGANQILLEVFAGVKSVEQEVGMFGSIIEIVEELEVHFQNESERKRIVMKKLVPAFSAWKILMESEFKPYLQH